MFARLFCLSALLAVVAAAGAKSEKAMSEGRFMSAFKSSHGQLKAKAMAAKNSAQDGQHVRKSKSGRSYSIAKNAPVRAMTSSQYVTMDIYMDSTCSYMYAAAIYGTDMCLSLDYASDGANSMQFTYSSSVLSQAFYSDSACANLLESETVADFTGDSQNTCISESGYSGMYSVSSSYSLPSSDGMYFGTYVSASACSANTPYQLAWLALSGDDDFFSLDDDYFDFTCVAGTVETGFDDDFDDDITDDDFSIAYNATEYITVGTSTGGSSSTSSTSCFAESETVQLANGELMSISEVRVGDVILAADSMGNTKFSEVIAVPHDTNSEVATFTRLATVSGADIKMTADHLVMVQPACSVSGLPVLMAAEEVKTGMCLMSAAAGLDEVASVSTVSGAGVYTVVTKEEMVVVNGFVASPFAVNHATANAYYNVVRAVSSVVPGLMDWSVVKQANLVFGSAAASMGF